MPYALNNQLSAVWWREKQLLLVASLIRLLSSGLEVRSVQLFSIISGIICISSRSVSTLRLDLYAMRKLI